MRPVHSFPPGSGWTPRHWVQTLCATAIAGAAATASTFPTTAGVCHVIQTTVAALFLQVALTTDSIAAARRLERTERVTPVE